jgi:hypothetical protein
LIVTEVVQFEVKVIVVPACDALHAPRGTTASALVEIKSGAAKPMRASREIRAARPGVAKRMSFLPGT